MLTSYANVNQWPWIDFFSFIAGLQVPQLPKESIKRPPNQNAVAVLEKTITIQGLFIAFIRDTRVLLARKGICSELLQVLNQQGRVFVKYLLRRGRVAGAFLKSQYCQSCTALSDQ